MRWAFSITVAQTALQRLASPCNDPQHAESLSCTAPGLGMNKQIFCIQYFRQKDQPLTQVRIHWRNKCRIPAGIKGKQPHPLLTHHVSSPSTQSPGVHHAWPLPHANQRAADAAGRHHPPSSCLYLRPQKGKEAVGHPSPWLTATTYQLYKPSCLKDWCNLARRSPEQCSLYTRMFNTSPSDPDSSRAHPPPSDIMLHVPHPLRWHIAVYGQGTWFFQESTSQAQGDI